MEQCLINFSLAALTDPSAAAAQQAMLQQQLSVLAYSPYGDSPLFRNQLSDPKKKEEVTAAFRSHVFVVICLQLLSFVL